MYLHFWCDIKYFSEYCIRPPPHYTYVHFFQAWLYIHVLYMLIATSLYVLYKAFSMFCAHMRHILVHILPMPSKSEPVFIRDTFMLWICNRTSKFYVFYIWCVLYCIWTVYFYLRQGGYVIAHVRFVGWSVIYHRYIDITDITDRSISAICCPVCADINFIYTSWILIMQKKILGTFIIIKFPVKLSVSLVSLWQ